MNTTLLKTAEGNMLSITLRKLDITPNSIYETSYDRKIMELFYSLSVLTPTNHSHIGKKFEQYSKLTKNKTDEFVRKIFNGLGIKNIFVYKSYTCKSTQKTDLYESVINCTDSMICLRCDSGLKEELYGNLRNSIAHGNIVNTGEYYVFYSISNDKEEYDSNIKFFLKIKKLSRLKAFTKVLALYE